VFFSLVLLDYSYGLEGINGSECEGTVLHVRRVLMHAHACGNVKRRYGVALRRVLMHAHACGNVKRRYGVALRRVLMHAHACGNVKRRPEARQM
jgi:hypothetical protein